MKESGPSKGGKGRTVMITGGAGFVGTTLAERMSDSGPDRLILVDAVESERSRQLVDRPNVEFRRVDLRDLSAVDEVVSECQAIVHLAAVRSRMAATEARAAHEVNVGATFDLISAAGRHQVERFVFSSTNTVYGRYRDPAALPFREDGPWECRGINLYAATKLAGEAYLEAFAGMGGAPYLALRIGPIYGPRVAAGSNSSMMLDIVDAIDKGKRPAITWTRDSIHSFVHVNDVADALAASLEAERTNMVVNVVGAPVTTETFCHRLIELYGGDPSAIHWIDQRKRYQRVSQDRMREVLDFMPGTSLEEGLQSFIDWHRGGGREF